MGGTVGPFQLVEFIVVCVGGDFNVVWFPSKQLGMERLSQAMHHLFEFRVQSRLVSFFLQSQKSNFQLFLKEGCLESYQIIFRWKSLEGV